MRGFLSICISLTLVGCSSPEHPAEPVETTFFRQYDLNKFTYIGELNNLDEVKGLIFGKWGSLISDDELASMPRYQNMVTAYRSGNTLVHFSSSTEEWVAAYDGSRFIDCKSDDLYYRGDQSDAMPSLTEISGIKRYTSNQKRPSDGVLGLNGGVRSVDPVYSIGVIVADVYGWRCKYRSLTSLLKRNAWEKFIDAFDAQRVAWRVSMTDGNIFYAVADGDKRIAIMGVVEITENLGYKGLGHENYPQSYH